MHTNRSRADFEQAAALIAARLFRCFHHLEMHRCLFLKVSAEIDLRVVNTEAKLLYRIIEDSRHLFATSFSNGDDSVNGISELENCLQSVCAPYDRADLSTEFTRLNECIGKLYEQMKILSQNDL